MSTLNSWRPWMTDGSGTWHSKRSTGKNNIPKQRSKETYQSKAKLSCKHLEQRTRREFFTEQLVNVNKIMYGKNHAWPKSQPLNMHRSFSWLKAKYHLTQTMKDLHSCSEKCCKPSQKEECTEVLAYGMILLVIEFLFNWLFLIDD